MGQSFGQSAFQRFNAKTEGQMHDALLKSPPPNNNPDAVILQLPVEILNDIFDELDILDRCALAFGSKRLSQVALTQGHLDYLLNQPPTWAPCNISFNISLVGAGSPSISSTVPTVGNSAQRHKATGGWSVRSTAGRCPGGSLHCGDNAERTDGSDTGLSGGVSADITAMTGRRVH